MYIEVPIALIFFCFTLEGKITIFFFQFSFVINVYFSFYPTEAVTTNFILDRTCYVLLGFNQSDCALLGTSNATNATIALEEKVQPTASVILMTIRIIGNIVPILCSFIVGPWSNKHGRKPILLSAFTGKFSQI